jgi:translation initiation factor IF-2
MPQTIEAINHAKAAPHVKIMVAINKMTRLTNIDRGRSNFRSELTPEDWGGETITVPVSATRGLTSINFEMMTLQAEVMELKASPTAKARHCRSASVAGRADRNRHCPDGALRVGDAFILRRLQWQSEIVDR